MEPDDGIDGYLTSGYYVVALTAAFFMRKICREGKPKTCSWQFIWTLFYEKLGSKSSGFRSCKWSWAPREANWAAHAAAALVKEAVGPLRWASQPPLVLVSVLRNVGLPVPPAGAALP
ncbi:hypothetical protein ACLB2K_032573 [Fragaria x ananassa]